MTQENGTAMVGDSIDPEGAGQESPMGPGELVNAWHAIKGQVDVIEGRLSSLLGYADRIRLQLLQEFDIMVPSLAMMSTGDPDAKSGQPSDSSPPSVPSAEELKTTDPKVAAAVEAGLPAQRAIVTEGPVTTTLDVDKIRENAKTEGENPEAFRQNLGQMMGNVMKTLEQ